MKHLAFSGIVFAFALSGVAADAPTGQKLEGTYKALALTHDGKDEPEAVVETVSVKIAAEEMIFTVKGKTFPAKIKLNPKEKPAAIDIAPSDGPDKGNTFLGIYKIEKGELLIAFAERGDRPMVFKGERGVLLIRLQKIDKK